MYRIIRFYAPHLNRRPKTIKAVSTLEIARLHCNDPRTKREGEYFDGYTKLS